MQNSSLGQNRNQAKEDIQKIKYKTIQFLNFKWKYDPVNLLFKNSKIMKMKKILTSNNCLFVYYQINEDLLSNFDNFFTTSENQHPYNTWGRKTSTVIKTFNSMTYSLNSETNSCLRME